MSTLDTELLAERVAVVERRLRRVAEKLPANANDLRPASDTSDAVVLHLWQATQIVIDLALSACLRFGLGTPTDYGDAFRKLASAGILAEGVAERLARPPVSETSSLTRTIPSTSPWSGSRRPEANPLSLGSVHPRHRGP